MGTGRGPGPPLRKIIGSTLHRVAKLDHFNDAAIAVIGMGYVGLPLALEFGKSRSVVGFDIDPERVAELNAGSDRNSELADDHFAVAPNISFSSSEADISACHIFIVAVPTPIDPSRQPDLRPLLNATALVGRCLKVGDLVIFESTVYPGVTDDICIPALEEESGLLVNSDFYVGYSPERVNPGDSQHTITQITKVISGSNPVAADVVDQLYASIIEAGTYKAESIRVAEAAKVIENTQRDLNIALVNELSMIFGKMGLDTNDVLRAAATKWNFMPFTPGLVGGHCVGVDPYYLTYKAEQIGHTPEVILAGRRLNDSMGQHVALRMRDGMIDEGIVLNGARVLIMGLTFKENCSDIRNSKVIDVVSELKSFGVTVDVYDPHVEPRKAKAEFDIDLCTNLVSAVYDGILIAVSHDAFRTLGIGAIRSCLKPVSVLFDLKSMFPSHESQLRL